MKGITLEGSIAGFLQFKKQGCIKFTYVQQMGCRNDNHYWRHIYPTDKKEHKRCLISKSYKIIFQLTVKLLSA